MTTLDDQLDRHRAELLGCRRCNHGTDVRPIVSLARAPRVMLVGQAPGKTESAGGRPFAGRAGRTLFSWLGTAGIDEAAARERIYISAITRCYPGPSPSGRGDRVPNPAERANCSTWLESELRMIRPALVIPVGRLAIDALIGARPLDQVIGREFTLDPTPDASRVLSDDASRVLTRDVSRMRAVPLPHPSGASSWIHAPGHRELLDEALRRIGRHWSRLQRAGGVRAA